MLAWLRAAAPVLSTLTLGGCGLLLDPGPPRPDATTSALDAGRGIDAQVTDAGDASRAIDGGSNEEPDAAIVDLDAAIVDLDAARPDAPASPPDAAMDARPVVADDAHVSRDAADADARDAPDGDAPDAPDGDARALVDARGVDARTFDAFCTSSGACDLLTQCGCTASQACQFGSPPRFDPICAPPGPVARGGLCMAEADCGRGLTCAYLGDPPGVCTPFCAPGSTCASDGLCLSLGPVSDPLPVGACSPNCNPFALGSCAGGLVCDVANDPSSFSYCRVDGPTAVGSSCTAPTSCGARATCVGAVCRALCTTGVPCGSGTCMPFTPPVSVGGFAVGFCSG